MSLWSAVAEEVSRPSVPAAVGALLAGGAGTRFLDAAERRRVRIAAFFVLTQLVLWSRPSERPTPRGTPACAPPRRRSPSSGPATSSASARS